MSKFITLFGGALAGAGIMYLLDPERGRRRRHILADKVGKSLHQAEQGVDVGLRDMGHRTRGMMAEFRSALRYEESVPDEMLVSRIRSRIGHVIRHPHMIDIRARKGYVILSGPLLQRHLTRLLRTVLATPGVRQLENRLEIHDNPNGIPSLQIASEQQPRRAKWSPALRLAAVAAGVGSFLYGLARRPALSTIVASAGLALAATAVRPRRQSNGKNGAPHAPRPVEHPLMKRDLAGSAT
jgi:hypothetical protein